MSMTYGELSDWLDEVKKKTPGWQNSPVQITLNGDKFWDPEVTLDQDGIIFYDEFLTEGVEFELDYDDCDYDGVLDNDDEEED